MLFPCENIATFQKSLKTEEYKMPLTKILSDKVLIFRNIQNIQNSYYIDNE